VSLTKSQSVTVLHNWSAFSHPKRYAAFKALQQRPLTSGVLSAADVAKWLQRQYYKNTVLTESDVQKVFEQFAESGLLRYEAFLKLILPKEDKSVRSLVMCRRTSGHGAVKSIEAGDIGREAGYHFIRLLEQETNLYEELVLRKKRLYYVSFSLCLVCTQKIGVSSCFCKYAKSCVVSFSRS